MKCRVITDGEEFKVQQRFLFFWWCDVELLNEHQDSWAGVYGPLTHKAVFKTLKEAEDCVEELKRYSWREIK